VRTQIKLNAEDQAKNTVTGGPLGDATYVLSSLYSNWGKTGDEVRGRVKHEPPLTCSFVY
jgi:hypothetical protein